MTKNPQPHLQPLTEKEKMVLEFIESYMVSMGVPPTYQEIKSHFGFSSFNSVQRYLKQLQKKEYIKLAGSNQKRSIMVLRSARSLQDSMEKMKKNQIAAHHPNVTGAPATEPLSLPLLGRVAAGQPIEALEHNEFVDTPPFMLRNPAKSFALLVQGQSMIGDGIFDGDYIIVQEQASAHNGEIVVATVEEEATVKRIFLDNKKQKVELRPANESMESMWFDSEQVSIRGVVVGLMRKYLRS